MRLQGTHQSWQVMVVLQEKVMLVHMFSSIEEDRFACLVAVNILVKLYEDLTCEVC